LVRWWTELVHVHYFIALVTFIGLLESSLWYFYFKDWNDTGFARTPLFTTALAFTVLKSVFSYMAALLLAQGWAVTQPTLDCRTFLKVAGLSLVYAILAMIQQTVLTATDFHTTPSITLLLSCLLPVAILNGTIFFWIFSSLSKLMTALQERKETEKLLLFERLWSLTITALTVVSIAMLCEMVDTTKNIEHRWHHGWIFSDAVPHTAFVLVLVVVMYLLAPSSNSLRYGYALPVSHTDADGAVKDSHIWADDEDPEEEEEKGDSAARSSGVKPERIGLAGDEEQESLTMTIE